MSQATERQIARAEAILWAVLPPMLNHDQAVNNLYYVDPNNDTTRLLSIAAAVYILRQARVLPVTRVMVDEADL
jgi:hypothetical protein